MSARKAKRRPMARNKYETPETLQEVARAVLKVHGDKNFAADRGEAIHTLLEAGQLDSIRKMHFCDADRNMPIAGTPRAKHCPFCGKADDISVVIEDELKDHEGKPSTRVHVECGVCGAESPAAISGCQVGDDSTYGLVLKAVEYWQRRGGAR